jgi:hypothetical protein
MPNISYNKQYNIYVNLNVTAALRNANFMFFIRVRVAYKARYGIQYCLYAVRLYGVYACQHPYL